MSEEHGSKEHKVDRAGWGHGPWDGEPDKVVWEHQGVDCMIVRGPMGALCGYVGTHEGHPWFGVGYSELDPALEVHGGLTYGKFCQGHICHPKAEKTYWLGFDCNHAGDFAPGMKRYMGELYNSEERYRDMDYVKAEVEQLAEQAKAVLPPTRSWAPEVIADSTGTWAGNGLRFAKRENAEAWVVDLSLRWFLVRDTRVVASTDEPNQEGR